MGQYSIKLEDELHVLVTGFDKFLDDNENPSWLIAHSLPSTLEPNKPGERRINIHAHPRPLKVAYEYVREQLPPILFPDGGKLASTRDDEALESLQKQSAKPNFNFVILLGMAAGIDYYTMESLGHRDGYAFPDVDGKRLIGDTYWKDLGAPETLTTDLDVDHVWRLWKEDLPNEDLRPSADAGSYLCDFSLYTSLSEYWRRRAKRSVTFLHVPGKRTETDLERGRRVAEGLIRAIARSESFK